MKEAVLVEPKKFNVKEVTKPKINKDEVLIKIKSCGICGSELEPFLGNPGCTYPTKLGHEIAGIIEEAGEAVTCYKVGDLVTGRVSPGFAEYTKGPEKNLLPIPQVMSFDEASMAEPIACIVSAVKRIPVKIGDKVAVIGCGFMGLLLIQCLAQRLAESITAIDMRKETFEMAQKCGASLCLSPADSNFNEQVAEITKGNKFDVVVEVTGSNKALELAGELTRIRGSLVIFGYHQGIRNVNMQQWNWKGLDVINAHERSDEVYMNSMEIGLNLLHKGKITLDGLITHKFPLGQINDAFKACTEKTNGCIKAVINP